MAPLNVLAANANLNDIAIVNLIGPMLLGFLWGYCLYGILIVQMYIYYVHFPKDSVFIKIYVWVLFFFESVFAVLCTVAAWKIFASGWGDLNALVDLDWSWKPMPAMNGYLAFMAQSFYVWRIWKLTNNYWTPAFIECFAALQFIASLYYGTKVDIAKRFDKVSEQSTVISVWLSASAFCDALITIAFVVVLRRAYAKSHFKRTSNIVTTLIRYTVETGLVTAIMALAELVLWLALTKWNFHYTIFITLGRIYSNALMATLNSRALIFVDDATETTSLQFINTTSNAFWDDPKRQSVNTSSSSTAQVFISRTQETHSPGEDHEMVVVPNLQASKNGDTSSLEEGKFLRKY